MKISLERLNNIFELAEEKKIRKHEDRPTEIIQFEEEKKERKRKRASEASESPLSVPTYA